MPVIVFFLIMMLLFIISLIYNLFYKKWCSKMTYDKLLVKCKKLIDDGKYDHLQKTLRLYPRLLLLHFNEFQTVLIDYARKVEENSANNEFKGG